MFFILLGAILFGLSSSVFKNSTNPAINSLGKNAKIGAGLLILIGVLSSCFIQVEPGQVGVKTLFGKVQGDILTEGLNIVNPMMEVSRFDVRTQTYTMSGVHDEGDKSGDDAIKVLTSDGLEVVIDLSVLYHITSDKAPDILRNLGLEVQDKIVRPVSRTKIRDNAVFYDAISLYSSKRDEFQMKIFQSIEKDFTARGIVLEQLLIRNISLPESVKLAIESKINAEQESQKMKFVLEKERQEADRKRVEAQGISDYQRILTSTLTDKLLQYEQIKTQKEVATSPNAKIIFMNGSKAPILLGQ